MLTLSACHSCNRLHICHRSELLLQHRTIKVVVPGIQENRFDYTGCTGGTMARLTGLQICTRIGYPNASQAAPAPYFPLTGPAHINVELVKHDQSITSYRFLHKIQYDKVSTN